MFGTIVTLLPLIGLRVYADLLYRNISCIFIPILVVIEISGQTARTLSLTLRVTINAIAGHNLIAMGATFIGNLASSGFDNLWNQLLAYFILTLLGSLMCFEFVIANIQSYVIVILEAYYELDSE